MSLFPQYPHKYLLVIGHPFPSGSTLAAVAKEFSQGELFIWGNNISAAVLKEWGLTGAELLGPGTELWKAFKCLLRIRRFRVECAVFVGQRQDLLSMMITALSGARNRLFQTGKENTFRRGRIQVWRLLPGVIWYSFIFVFSLSLLPVLRLAFSFPRKKEQTVMEEKIIPLGDDEKAPISIVIPNFNGRELLAECLPSLSRAFSTYSGRYEIIVVDDASSDGSTAWLQADYPVVKLIPLKVNVGFGAAVNLGVKAAAYRRVILLNSDIKVAENFLAPLLPHLLLSDVFAIQPRMEDWDGESLDLGLNVGRFEDGYVQIWNEKDIPEYSAISDTLPSLYAVGGAMAFDREKWLALGGFDDLFRPFFWEDIDISYRAWKRGWRVLYEPDSRVYHLHHGTISRFFSQDYKKIMERKNELLFIWKNIHSPILWREHWHRLPRLLFFTVFSGDDSFRKGLWRAARCWRWVCRQRWKEIARYELRDEVIFQISFLPYLDHIRSNLNSFWELINASPDR